MQTMPVTVLLIEGNDARAQAMALALEIPWRQWHLVRATTVEQARPRLLSDGVDLVLVARCLADGSAYDVLPAFSSLRARRRMRHWPCAMGLLTSWCRMLPSNTC